jgi:plasmid replication initiation protein
MIGTELVTANGAHYLVTQSNRLIESGHTLTLNEKRLVLACASKLDPRKELPENGTIQLTAAEFASSFGLDKRDAYDALAEAASRLYERTIRELQPTRNGKKIRNTRWVWRAEYAQGDGYVTVGFSPEVLPHLTMLHKEFTTYELRYIGNLSSFYAIRLYEICSQFRKTGERMLGLERLRDIFDLGDKYQDVKNLRVRVLDPAVADVNKHTDLRVTMETMRKGRKVTGFHFDIEVDGQPELPL